MFSAYVEGTLPRAEVALEMSEVRITNYSKNDESILLDQAF